MPYHLKINSIIFQFSENGRLFLQTQPMPSPEPNTDTLANSLAERIRRDILARGLKKDDLFMTEAGVVEHYQVSRNIAREAVSQLRALGVLKSRQAKGLLVASSNPVDLLSRSLPFFGNSAGQLRQLAQLRYVLETGAIDLAVLHAADEQVRELLDLAVEFEKVVGTSREDEIELAFHSLLLKMSGNPLISGMHQVVVDYFQWAARVPGRIHGEPGTAWQHRAIAEAIRQRDVEQARALLRQHLQPMLH